MVWVAPLSHSVESNVLITVLLRLSITVCLTQTMHKKMVWKCERQSWKLKCKWIKMYVCNLWLNLTWSELSGNQDSSAAKDAFNAQKNICPAQEAGSSSQMQDAVAGCLYMLHNKFVTITTEMFKKSWRNTNAIRNGITDVVLFWGFMKSSI